MRVGAGCRGPAWKEQVPKSCSHLVPMCPLFSPKRRSVEFDSYALQRSLRLLKVFRYPKINTYPSLSIFLGFAVTPLLKLDGKPFAQFCNFCGAF